MRRTTPPRMAAWLLERFAVDGPLIGDLAEELRKGRSAAWYWRQVLAAVVMTSAREVGGHKLNAMRAIATGWAVLLLIFTFLGDRVANGLAYRIWGWTRPMGYSSAYVWQPFHITAAFVSYAGFGLSAWVVVRSQREHALPMLLAYLVSVVGVLSSAATFIARRAPRPISVPHPFYYVISLTLPYVWRSGLVFLPLTILIVGLWSAPRVKAHGAAA
jgi:hypothetical protein